jgi:hypothetical protein
MKELSKRIAKYCAAEEDTERSDVKPEAKAQRE